MSAQRKKKTGNRSALPRSAVGQSRPEAKIVAAIERISHAMRLVLWESAADLDDVASLSPIQVQTLIFLHQHDEYLARVSELAREFALTPPTMSDAVSALERKELITKERLESDRRQVVLRLTPEGARAARRLAGWTRPFESALQKRSATEKAALLESLLATIRELQDDGIVDGVRMCYTCRYFGENEHPDAAARHHCHLVDRPLAASELRIDCAEHEPAA